MEGPLGVVDENIEERRGNMNKMRSGRRFDKADIAVAGRSSVFPPASRGLRLGRPPPN